MQTAYFFKNMFKPEEEKLLTYMEKKFPRIEKFLKRHAADSVHLHITGEKFDKHSAYNVELKLQLGSDEFLASEASHEITKAVDLSVDRLEMQLIKAGELARRQHRSMRLRREIKQTAGVVA